jgi:zinc/manganese transport system permease protein
MSFLVIVALATTMTVPVVGAFLMFSLMIAPAASARLLTSRPSWSMGLSVVIAVVTVWAAVFASYESQWPVGFFVGTIGTAAYGAARVAAYAVRTRSVRPAAVIASLS